MSGLCLHTGGKEVDRSALKEVVAPAPTKSYVPIPHHEFADLVQNALQGAGYTLTGEQHALNDKGETYFAVFNLKHANSNPDYSVAAGIRNSHNKKLPAGLSVGSRVFVCDNLAFSGDVVFARRHTAHIMRDLPGIIKDAMGQVETLRMQQDMRIAKYKEVGISDPQVHDFVIRAMDAEAINLKRLHLVLADWRTPRHEEFKPRTLWSLFNAFTEVYKGTPVDELPKRSLALHTLMDDFAGLKIANCTS